MCGYKLDEIASKTLCFKRIKYTFDELLKHMKSKNIWRMLMNSGNYIIISQFRFH